MKNPLKIAIGAALLCGVAALSVLGVQRQLYHLRINVHRAHGNVCATGDIRQPGHRNRHALSRRRYHL